VSWVLVTNFRAVKKARDSMPMLFGYYFRKYFSSFDLLIATCFNRRLTPIVVYLLTRDERRHIIRLFVNNDCS
jgi:hypothetical protein